MATRRPKTSLSQPFFFLLGVPKWSLDLRSSLKCRIRRSLFCKFPSTFSYRLNAQGQLPGRLLWLQSTESQNAGPVNCILSFGYENLRCPLFGVAILQQENGLCHCVGSVMFSPWRICGRSFATNRGARIHFIPESRPIFLKASSILPSLKRISSHVVSFL